MSQGAPRTPHPRPPAGLSCPKLCARIVRGPRDTLGAGRRGPAVQGAGGSAGLGASEGEEVGICQAPGQTARTSSSRQPGRRPGPERLSHLPGHSCRDPFSPILAPQHLSWAEQSPAVRTEQVSGLQPVQVKGPWSRSGLLLQPWPRGPCPEWGGLQWPHRQEWLVLASVVSSVKSPQRFT